MATYKTMQKKCVLQILSSYPGRAFTVRDIEEIIRTDQSISCKPSESSVYRIINDLVSGGSVHKSVNNKREYQYTLWAVMIQKSLSDAIMTVDDTISE